MLSILKFLDRKRLVILNKTPGLFSTSTEIIDHISDHYDGKIISLSDVPGATKGNTSSCGSIGMSMTVATLLFSAVCTAFPTSSMVSALIPRSEERRVGKECR